MSNFKRILICLLIATGIGVLYSIFEVNILLWISNDANAYARIFSLHFNSILLYAIFYLLIGIFFFIFYSAFKQKKKELATKDFYLKWALLLLLFSCYFPLCIYLNISFLPGLFSISSIISNVFILIAFVISFLMLNKKATSNFNSAAGILKNILIILIISAVVSIGISTAISFNRKESLNLPEYNSKYDKSEPNIILIVIDTLRADFLSCYGYPKKISPYIDAMSRKGILFEKVYASSPWTLTSLASILTSLHPFAHHVDDFESVLDDSFDTLPEILRKFGYSTIAFIGNPIIEEQQGFAQGFDYYDNYGYEVEKNMMINRVVAYVLQNLHIIEESYSSSYWVFSLRFHSFWPFFKRASYVIAEDLNKRIYSKLETLENDKFFLYIHYMDPHAPYLKHPNILCREPMLVPENMTEIISVYEGEIEYVDAHIGTLMKKLQDYGFIKNSIIIITSDHGEEFYEHKGWHHGSTLYDESLVVPLIIIFPHPESEYMNISSQVSIIDIMPTLLAHIKRMNSELQSIFHGRDLTDLLRSPEEKQRFIYFENKLNKLSQDQLKKGVCTKNYKLIKNQNLKKKIVSYELYDIKNDSEEKQKLSVNNIVEAQVLLNALKEFEKLDRPMRSAPKKIRKELEKKLKALGYIH
jgi:arylsulfatase A-like enzyme